MFSRITRFLFLLLIVSLPLVRPFNTTIFGLLVPFSDFIFLACFGMWIMSILRNEKKFYFKKFYVYLGLYGLAALLSTVFSIDPTSSFHKFLGVIYLILLAVLTFNVVENDIVIRRILLAFCVGSLLTIVGSILGMILFYIGYKTRFDNFFLSHLGSLPAGNYPRIQSFFLNPNMMANFLNVSILFGLMAQRLGWLKIIWSQILLIGGLFAAFFTLSPGIGGIVLSLSIWSSAMFSFENLKYKSRIILGIGILVAACFFFVTIISPDTQNTDQGLTIPFIGKTIEPSVRVLIWENTLETVKRYPFFGKGTGMDVANVQYLTLSGDNQTLLDAHNVWLNVFGQFGLFGLVMFLSLCVFLFLKCRFYLADKTEDSYIRLGLSCAFVGAFLYQGLSGSFEDARHLWILFGLIASLKT